MEKDPQKMIQRMLRRSLFLGCTALAILIVIGFSAPAFAQVGGGGNPCPGGEPCDPEVPIAGIEWLLAIGGLFGFRKIYYRFKGRKA